MRNNRALVSLLGMAAMVDGLSALGMDRPASPQVSQRMQLTGVTGGHKSWGNPHDSKANRSISGRAQATIPWVITRMV